MHKTVNTVERERYTLENKGLLSILKNIDIVKGSNTISVSDLDTG